MYGADYGNEAAWNARIACDQGTLFDAEALGFGAHNTQTIAQDMSTFVRKVAVLAGADIADLYSMPKYKMAQHELVDEVGAANAMCDRLSTDLASARVTITQCRTDVAGLKKELEREKTANAQKQKKRAADVATQMRSMKLALDKMQREMKVMKAAQIATSSPPPALSTRGVAAPTVAVAGQKHARDEAAPPPPPRAVADEEDDATHSSHAKTHSSELDGGNDDDDDDVQVVRSAKKARTGACVERVAGDDDAAARKVKERRLERQFKMLEFNMNC